MLEETREPSEILSNELRIKAQILARNVEFSQEYGAQITIANPTMFLEGRRKPENLEKTRRETRETL